MSYDPKLPLLWSLDFNTNPLCSVLAQMENGKVRILEELILPDSNTWAACEEFLARTRKWTAARETLAEPLPEAAGGDYDTLPAQLEPPLLNVYVYGDATGEQRRTSASRTDWQIIKKFFGQYPDRYRASFRVPSSNPPVKDRINCVNALLRNHAGQCRLSIDPGCKQLIKDFEQVSWKADPHGNPLADLDKSDPMRTHVSDAAGYLIEREFPMRSIKGERGGPAIL